MSQPGHEQGTTEYWRSILSGDDAGLRRTQDVFSRLPKAPRCKLCSAPFAGPFAPALRLAGFRRWEVNQQLCAKCFTGRIAVHGGGAEIEVSILFADVRGSTTLAESMSPTDFSSALNHFYGIVRTSVDHQHGVIDHMAGDGVMALWIPAFVGSHHARRAIDAAVEVSEKSLGSDLAVGVGVHTGIAYVGVVGEGGARDFTALGDVPNTASRLSSASSAGAVLASKAAVEAAGFDVDDGSASLLDLKGKDESVWAYRVR